MSKKSKFYSRSNEIHFSNKEKTMLTNILGHEKMHEMEDMYPMEVYMCAVESAFINLENLPSKDTESLRRCYTHLQDGGNRSENDFDDLIKLD